MRRLVLAVAVTAVLLAGCETTYRQIPTISATGSNSTVRFSRGEALMISQGRRGTVWLRPVRYFKGDKVYFEVTAFNESNLPVNFGTEDIDLTTGAGSHVGIYDFDSLRVQARKHAEADLMAAYIVEGIDLWHAERVRRRDPYKSAAIWRNSQNQFIATGDAIEIAMEDAISYYARRTLQTTTVDPYTAFGGVVFSPNIEVPRGTQRELLANVRFAGEDHQFRLRIAPEGTPAPVQSGLPAASREQVSSGFHTPETWMFDH